MKLPPRSPRWGRAERERGRAGRRGAGRHAAAGANAGTDGSPRRSLTETEATSQASRGSKSSIAATAGGATPGNCCGLGIHVTRAAPSAAPTPPARETFVPGPTSQYVRTRPAPPRPAPGSRRDQPKLPRLARARPRPSKRVPARADEGKPKSKRKAKRPRTASVPDVVEQSLPEPMPRVDDRKPATPKVFRKIALTEGVTVKELAEKLEVKHKDVIKVLLGRGVLATINQTLDAIPPRNWRNSSERKQKSSRSRRRASRGDERREARGSRGTRPGGHRHGHVDHERRACSMPSARRKSSRKRRAASPNTSAPTA